MQKVWEKLYKYVCHRCGFFFIRQSLKTTCWMKQISFNNLSIRFWNCSEIQDFKLRGAHLKKNAPSRGRREIFGGISCEKSRFYAKKSHFIHIAEGGAKCFGVFRVKNHDFTQKIMFFPILGGARPWIRPWRLWYFSCVSFINMLYNNIKL